MFGHKAVSFTVPDGGPIWSGQQASESSDCSMPVCPASEVAQAASSDASDELSERLPNLSELLSGSSSSKRRARRTLHAEPVDEYGCLRTPEDLKKVKRRMANRDSAALAAARKLRTVEEARAEIETVLRDMQGLKRQLSRLRKQHQDMKQEAGASMQALTGVMDRNALLAARVAALQQAVALQDVQLTGAHAINYQHSLPSMLGGLAPMHHQAALHQHLASPPGCQAASFDSPALPLSSTDLFARVPDIAEPPLLHPMGFDGLTLVPSLSPQPSDVSPYELTGHADMLSSMDMPIFGGLQ